jgi:cytochrome c oxidase cbb3-type subunit II
MAYKHFEIIEKNVGLLGSMIAIMVSLGGLAEITPLFIEAHTIKAPPGVRPYDPLRLAGRDIYVREGCFLCHSQQIRALRFETQRYGHYSTVGESVYDRPFQWGSKRIGPDLARIGGKYSDDWQRMHLMNPRQLVPQSNMPDFPWLAERKLDAEQIQASMRTLRRLGDPYSDADIASAPSAVSNKTEMEALIAHLQGLGIKNEPTSMTSAEASDGGAP